MLIIPLLLLLLPFEHVDKVFETIVLFDYSAVLHFDIETWSGFESFDGSLSVLMACTVVEIQ
jgi:ABC-type polysaccharide transport system permease subunit